MESVSHLIKPPSLAFISIFGLFRAGRGLGLLVLLASAAPALADQLDVINCTATAGYSYDNNVYRLPSSIDPQLVIGHASKSDRIRSILLGVNIDKKYSNQNVMFSANVTNNKYDTFSSLDYNGTAYSAAWNWTVSSRLSGALSVKRAQTLNSFAETQTYSRNLQTQDNKHLNADWLIGSGWHVFMGAQITEISNSISTINNLSYFSRADEWGVKYNPADKGSMALVSRNIHANTVNFRPDHIAQIDAGYTERQEELQFNWPFSGKSELSGSLMGIRHTYPLFAQRDYSGLQHRLGYAWGITDKFHLNVRMQKNINSWLDAASSYYVSDTISILPTWQVSSKIDMRVELSQGRSDYRGAIVANTVPRHDEDRSSLIGLGWQPQKSVKLMASMQHSRRNSNYGSYSYSDTLANLSITTTF